MTIGYCAKCGFIEWKCWCPPPWTDADTQNLRAKRAEAAHVRLVEAIKGVQAERDAALARAEKAEAERDSIAEEAEKALHHEKTDNARYLARAWAERDAALARAKKAEAELLSVGASAAVLMSECSLLKAERDRLREAISVAWRCLHKFSWEGSSVNFPARTAMNDIRRIYPADWEALNVSDAVFPVCPPAAAPSGDQQALRGACEADRKRPTGQPRANDGAPEAARSEGLRGEGASLHERAEVDAWRERVRRELEGK